MLSLIISIFVSSAAQAQVAFAPTEGQYKVRGEFQYLTTSANYDSGGTSTSLLNGGKLTRMLGAFEGSYDFSPAVRLWGGLSGGQTTVVATDPATNTTFTTPATRTLSNSGMTEGWLGGQWWTVFMKLDVVPQLDMVFPFARANMSSYLPMLGEGAIRFQGGSWVMYPMGDVVPFGYAGLAYRDEGRSLLVPYSVGVRYGRETDWWIQAEFRGFQSVSNDSATNTGGTRNLFLFYADGGSNEFDAVNPNRSDLAAMVGFRYNQVGLYLGGSKSVFGSNSADDYEVRVGVSFSGLVNGKLKRAAGVVPVSPEPNLNPNPNPNDRFQEGDAVKYDEKLFQEQVTPEPPPPPPAGEPDVVIKAKPKVAPRPKPKRKAPADVPMPNVELLMKDTQKSLEKRGK